MLRIRNNQKRWRLRWPWRVLFPLRVDEFRCPECGLPYHNGPLPEAVKRFCANNIEGLVYPATRRGEFVVRFGRWGLGSGKFFLGEFIPEEELDSLLAVVNQARDAYLERMLDRRARR